MIRKRLKSLAQLGVLKEIAGKARDSRKKWKSRL